MKSLLIALTVILSAQSFAALDAGKVSTLLRSRIITMAVKQLATQRYSLSKIEDVYAAKGVRPRCICENYLLTFSGYGVPTKVLNVNVLGFGENQQISINEVK